MKPEGFCLFFSSSAFKCNLVSIVTQSLKGICTPSVCCYELTYLWQEKFTALRIIHTADRDVKMLFAGRKLLYKSCSLLCDGDTPKTAAHRGEGRDFIVT